MFWRRASRTSASVEPSGSKTSSGRKSPGPNEQRPGMGGRSALAASSDIRPHAPARGSGLPYAGFGITHGGAMSAESVLRPAVSVSLSASACSLSGPERPRIQSVLPLFARGHLLFGDTRVTPLMLDGGVVGYVRPAVADAAVRLRPRLFRREEHSGTPVLALRDASAAALDDAMRALEAVFPACDVPFLSLPAKIPLMLVGGMSVPRRLAPLLGLRLHSLSVVAFTTANACGASAARYSVFLFRTPSSPPYASVMHVCLETGVPPSREALSDMAHASFGLQPEALRHLRPTGVLPVVRQAGDTGVERVLVQCNELDLSAASPGAAPVAGNAGCAVELVDATRAIALCLAGAVRDVDVWPLIAFGLRHGVISPETEPQYVRVAEALSYDLVRPFPYA